MIGDALSKFKRLGLGCTANSLPPLVEQMFNPDVCGLIGLVVTDSLWLKLDLSADKVDDDRV